ncbi:hypothetical protein ACD586_14725 [Xanthomonas campestris pv. campestris]|uniref:hypothetical protein n=1 Tax=Xanthomonas campestris TaxID=339 RepID=UPI003558A859
MPAAWRYGRDGFGGGRAAAEVTWNRYFPLLRGNLASIARGVISTFAQYKKAALLVAFIFSA